MTESGLGEKTRELDSRDGPLQIKWIRAMAAEKINAHLEAAGHAVRVDHRTLAVQAMDAMKRGDLVAAARLMRVPTQHEGKSATAAQKAGEVSQRRLVNDAIRKSNAENFNERMTRLRNEGRLMATPAGHSHEAALRDRSRPAPNAVERAALATAVKLGQLKVGSAPRRVRYKTGDTREDALAESRRAREDEIERLMLDALRIWQDGINTVLRSALGTSGGALLERPALIRQRPATANGTTFITLEDEEGVVQVIVWADLGARQRKELLGSRLLAVDGRWEMVDGVGNLIAGRLHDLSELLGGLDARSRDFH